MMVFPFDTIESNATLRLIERDAEGALATYDGPRLGARCDDWSSYLARAGVARGTPVILPLRSSIDAVSLLLATWRRGLLPIPVRPATPLAYLQALLDRLGHAVVVLDAASLRQFGDPGPIIDGSPSSRFIAQVIERAPGSGGDAGFPAGGDVGILTTGSTGQPKVIINSLERVARNALLHARAIGLEPGDTVGLSLPLSFSYGLVAGLVATLLVGARGVLIEPEQPDLGDALIRHGATVAMATPFTARRLMTAGPLGRVRTLTVGGDVLHATLARELLDRNPATRLYATYGLSEAGPRVATHHVRRDQLDALGAVPLGAPLDGVRWRLIDIDPQSGAGELELDTPTRMLGYLGDPEATARVLDPATGALATGDQFVARDGELFFAGRSKRVICRAGEKIYPALIERQILSLGNVRDVVVTAAPHDEYGEIARAYIIPDDAFSLRDLERHLRRTLPRSHIPDWHIVDHLPAGARK